MIFPENVLADCYGAELSSDEGEKVGDFTQVSVNIFNAKQNLFPKDPLDMFLGYGPSVHIRAKVYWVLELVARTGLH